jgi:5-methylcytosine-specific restriction enzyme A
MWQPTDRAQHLPKDWPAVRARIFRRDRGRCRCTGCRACGVRSGACGVFATDVDHVCRGDDHRDSNLQALCRDCHACKTAGEAGAASRQVLNRRRRPEAHPGVVAAADIP